MTNKKTRRRINGKLVALISIVAFLLIIVFCLPPVIKYNKIKSLGYDEVSIDVLYENSLEDLVIDDSLYTNSLNDALKSDSFDIKYLEVYKTIALISDEQKLIFDRLSLKGYTAVQIASLFNTLKIYEITPLLVFSYQENLELYINDCKNNNVINSKDSFTLTNSYVNFYTDTKEVTNLNSFDKLVSKEYYLPSDYEPSNLVELPLKYAARDVFIEGNAADHFKAMMDDMLEEDLRAYATNAYRSYDYQKTIYNQYVIKHGQEKADTFAARAGHSEHQTGLTLDITAVDMEGILDYEETPEYKWMDQNAHLYGFIQSYKKGKTSITGYQAESWHWRYLGVELATKVKKSNLTYNEYYELYIKQEDINEENNESTDTK